MIDKNFKKYVLTFSFLLCISLSQIHSWTYTESSFDVEGRVALMANAGRFNPYMEMKGKFHGQEMGFRYSSISAGSYFKIAPWLKLGAFYRLQSGARHLDDWRFTAGPPDKHWWIDTKSRFEHMVYFDATPRFRLQWMPGKNWVAPIKIRYFYNFTEDLHSLLIRPGLTYVIMPDREPVLNLSLNYNLYFALNSGEIPLYSHGPYLSVLGHVNDWLKLEGRASYKYSIYSKNGGSWILNSSKFTVGLGVIFTPDF